MKNSTIEEIKKEIQKVQRLLNFYLLCGNNSKAEECRNIIRDLENDMILEKLEKAV